MDSSNQHPSDGQHDVVDLRRAGSGAPPVVGAQWDELHEHWEVWNEQLEEWFVVAGASGELIVPMEEEVRLRLPLPHLARELDHAEEIDPIEDHVIDVDRLAQPAIPVAGAQWNEVLGRWERWDETSEAWVEALAASTTRHG